MHIFWPNRDPLGERGFQILRRHNAHVRVPLAVGILGLLEKRPDLYEFLENCPVSEIDIWGLCTNPDPCGCSAQFHDCLREQLQDWENDPDRLTPDEGEGSDPTAGGGLAQLFGALTGCAIEEAVCKYKCSHQGPGDYPSIPAG